MNIYLTLDYEIYFGENHGSVEKCIIYPTSELIRISEMHGVKFSFFVDSGFILKLDEYRKMFPVLEKDYKAIIDQVSYLSATGHDIQLHIHPHWEDSCFDGNKWIINLDRYKLADFNKAEIEEIVSRYKKVLVDITNKKIFAYRAGGWCLQPFSIVKDAFKKHEISVESSVYRGGRFFSKQYSYDFINAPDKDIYQFEDDLIVEKQAGFFTELPISSIKNSPLFFWILFFLGRKNPYLHKPLGNGKAMPSPGYRRNQLTKFTINPVSVDGYNAKLLQRVLKRLIKNNNKNYVIIGHPKALSRYSIRKIERFISKNKNQHNFTTYTNEFLNT